MIRAKSPFALSLVGILALTACTDTTDPNRQAKTGALAGATVGAVAGILASGSKSNKDRNRNAVAGALVGAAVGGVVGNQLDKQEAELRQQLGNNVGITNTGDRLIVTMPQDILFATDSATLRSDLQNDLRTVAASLQQYPDTNVQVIGHTDNTGDAAYNLDLSQRRAQSVAGVLISQGVPGFRVATFGRGEDQPITSNLTPEGRQQNRRVEIVILPTT